MIQTPSSSTLILSDIDSTKYPQPVYLAHAIAQRMGSCHLLDPLGLHPFSRQFQPEIRRRSFTSTQSLYASLWTRFGLEAIRLRPQTIIAINETNLAPAKTLSMLATGAVRFGAYFLDFWEDPLAVKTRRLTMGHRALQGGAPWLDFVIDCEIERLHRRTWISHAQHKTFVLRNAPPRNYVPAPQRRASDGPMRIVYAGRNDPNVFLERFLEALSRFNGAAELDLYLTGYEDRNRRVQNRARELNLLDRVHFHAPVSKSSLVQILQRANVGLSLYPCTEGLTNLNDLLCAPNKTFEYLACGLAAFASANPTLRFIEQEGLGVCVDPQSTDSILCGLNVLWNNRSFEQMGERARTYYETSLSYERDSLPILDYLASPMEI